MLHFTCSTKYFPLTLTLSLREREQQASDWCDREAVDHSPSPQGRGPGRGGTECSQSHGAISTGSFNVSGALTWRES